MYYTNLWLREKSDFYIKYIPYSILLKDIDFTLLNKNVYNL